MKTREKGGKFQEKKKTQVEILGVTCALQYYLHLHEARSPAVFSAQQPSTLSVIWGILDVTAADVANNFPPFLDQLSELGISKTIYLLVCTLHIATRYSIFGVDGIRAGCSIVLGDWGKINKYGCAPQ